MTEVLIATDADAVFAEVEAALADETHHRRAGARRARRWPAAVADSTPDLVVLDLQIGNMGGIATCLHLRHEAGAERLPEVPVLMLLDRHADVFLARRSGRRRLGGEAARRLLAAPRRHRHPRRRPAEPDPERARP